MAIVSHSIPPEDESSNSSKSQELDIDMVNLVVKNLYNHYQLDFRGYAEASLARRIKHVINIFGLNNANDLIYKIANEPDFKLSLIHEITVGATEMFRDSTFWVAFKNDILSQFDNKEDKIKFWIAGCSSGEEIFSLAILLKELDIYDRSEILATDLDPLVIDIARKGFYLNHSFVKNSENYIKAKGINTLDHYCTKGGMGYQMDLKLLDIVTFKNNDLIQESIDGFFDVIFCRNVMIYFNQEIQNEVLKKLRKNLQKGSFLAIGVKESIMWLKDSNQFDPIKRYEKIYQVKSNGTNT